MRSSCIASKRYPWPRTRPCSDSTPSTSRSSWTCAAGRGPSSVIGSLTTLCMHCASAMVIAASFGASSTQCAACARARCLRRKRRGSSLPRRIAPWWWLPSGPVFSSKTSAPCRCSLTQASGTFVSASWIQHIARGRPSTCSATRAVAHTWCLRRSWTLSSFAQTLSTPGRQTRMRPSTMPQRLRATTRFRSSSTTMPSINSSSGLHACPTQRFKLSSMTRWMPTFRTAKW
mmetsp:Transcript_24288/g.65851  ORF Transcript_24288/g.65851 Transcript_24288/m.65851 type:complete len:231 (+) Transcript_24288:273-965(+)